MLRRISRRIRMTSSRPRLPQTPTEYHPERIYTKYPICRPHLFTICTRPTSHSLERIINLRLIRNPLSQDIHIPKRHDLAGNHTRNAPLTITPPEQIRDAGPPSRVPTSACAAFLDREEEGETPALGRVACTYR